MIETNDLSKQFNNDFWAVDGVNLCVEPGKILALLGQNGAGKTTTVRMLTALLKPTRGWARVAGYDVTKNSQEIRANVGVLTEQHGLYMRMTGEEYLEFFGKVYVLDQPTSAMGPESSRLVRDEIARLRSSQRTIIICTHNRAEAEALADSIAIIYRGRILLNGTLDELKRAVLGPVEYEAKFAHNFDASDLSLPHGVTLASRSADSIR